MLGRSLLALLFVVACSTDDPSPPPDDREAAIDELVAGLGILPVADEKRVEGAPSAPITDGDFHCVDVPIDEVRQYDQLLGQIDIGDVLWPGSLLRGDSVYAALTPIVLDRAPLTFSVSLESLGSGARSATMTVPSLSAYRDAVAQILAQEVVGATPARIAAEIEEISSEEQLAVALGASVEAPLVATVKTGFDFGNSTARSRFLVKFYQIYYTADVDPPGAPHSFFAPSVTAEDIAQVAGDGNPPVYVSSIGYGRQVMFTFESDLSKTELAAALGFVYQGGADISGSVSLTHREVLAHTHTTAFILGGDAGEAAKASIGSMEELQTFITRGGNYSKDSPGAAIAYKLSYVRDHTPVKLAYASEYRQRTCTRTTQKLHVVFEKIVVDNAGGDAGGDLEVFGTVDLVGSDGVARSVAAFPRDGFKQIGAGASFPPSGIIGEAIVPVRPQPGNDLRVATNLFESDLVFGDDSFGVDATDAAPYEAGWRRTLQLHRSAGTQAITLQISLTPVP